MYGRLNFALGTYTTSCTRLSSDLTKFSRREQGREMELFIDRIAFGSSIIDTTFLVKSPSGMIHQFNNLCPHKTNCHWQSHILAWHCRKVTQLCCHFNDIRKFWKCSNISILQCLLLSDTFRNSISKSRKCFEFGNRTKQEKKKSISLLVLLPYFVYSSALNLNWICAYLMLS